MPKNPFFTEDNRIIELLGQALSLSESGEYQDAIEIYKSILLFEPDNGIAQIGKAFAEMKIAKGISDGHVQIEGFSNYFYTVSACLKKRAACGIDDEYISVALKFIDACEDEAMELVNNLQEAKRETIKDWQQGVRELREDGFPYNMTEHDKTEFEADTLPLLIDEVFLYPELLSTSNKIVDDFIASITEPEQINIEIIKQLSQLRENALSKENLNISKFMSEGLNIFRDFFTSTAPRKVAEARQKMEKIEASFDTTAKRIESLINELKDIARERYWTLHAEEKSKLEANKASLEQSIYDKQTEIEAKKYEIAKQIQSKTKEITEYEAVANDKISREQEKVSALEQEKKLIGFFKFKEKKAVKSKIAEAAKQLEAVRQEEHNLICALNEQKNSLEKQVKLFDKEFADYKKDIKYEISKIDLEFKKDRN